MPGGKDESQVLTDRHIKTTLSAELEGRYGEVLQQNSILRAVLNQIKQMEQNPLQAKRAKREVAKLEWDIVRQGIVRGGQRYYPASILLGSKMPGVEWAEGVAEALSQDEAQGKFGSLLDVYFAVQKGAELGPKKSAVFHLPPDSSSVVYLPKRIGQEVVVEVHLAKYVYVKVSRKGKVVALPSLTIEPAPPVRYAEKSNPILALKYRQIFHLADEVAKISRTIGVSEDIRGCFILI